VVASTLANQGDALPLVRVTASERVAFVADLLLLPPDGLHSAAAGVLVGASRTFFRVDYSSRVFFDASSVSEANVSAATALRWSRNASTSSGTDALEEARPVGLVANATLLWRVSGYALPAF